MRALLAPRGKYPGVGPEKGPRHPPHNGIARYVDPHGSHRYVLYHGGDAASVLQVMGQRGGVGTIANVYTEPAHRGMGHAGELLKRARRDFAEVRHAAEEHLSEAGRGWRAKVERHRRGGNPRKKGRRTMSDDNHLPGGFHVEESDVHKAWLVMLDNEVMRILLKKHYTRKQAEDEARRMASPLAACPVPQPWKGQKPTLPKSPKPEPERRGFDADDYILKERMRKLTRGR